MGVLQKCNTPCFCWLDIMLGVDKRLSRHSAWRLMAAHLLGCGDTGAYSSRGRLYRPWGPHSGRGSRCMAPKIRSLKSG